MNGFSIDVEALRAQHQGNLAVISTVTSTPTSTVTSEAKTEPPLPTVEQSRKKDEFSGWNLLCQAIDRVLFITYLVIILLFIASYLGGAAASAASVEAES